MGRGYIIDGKKYTFEEVSYTVGKEQVIKINGEEIRLSVKEGDGEECFMELKMPKTARDEANALLPAVYAITDKRIKDGIARKLEQVVMLQLHYNEALRAEDIARGLSGGRAAVHAVVNKEDLSVENENTALEMDLTESYPWLNDKNSKEYKSLQQIVKYRKIEYFPDGSLHDALARQRVEFERKMKSLAEYGGGKSSTHSSLVMRMLDDDSA